MKKLLCLFAVLGLLLTSCNYDLIDTHYEYHYCHLYETGKCYKVISWTDYEGEQIQVNLEGYGYVLTSSVNCMLITDKCPICDHNE